MALAGLPLAVGGVLPWAQGLALAVLLAGTLAYAVRRQRDEKTVPVPRLLWAGVAAWAWALIQVVPLPLGLVEVLAPATAAVHRELQAATGLAPAFVPLSLDAATTLMVPLRLALYLLTFLLGLFLARCREHLETLLKTLCWMGTGLVGVAAATRALHLEEVLGLYHPATALYPTASVFVNPDHAVAFLGLTTSATMGLVLLHREALRHWIYLSAITAQAALIALTPSVTAPLALAVLVTAFVVFLLRRRHSSEEHRRVNLFPLAVALFLVLVCLVAGWRVMPADWANALSLPRSGLLLDSLALLKRFPLFGVGAGAFPQAFAFGGPPAQVVYPAPDNALLQAVLELGLPAGVLLLGALAFMAWVPLREAWSHERAMGAVAGVVGLGLHELFDFSIQVPAVGVAFFALLGALFGYSTKYMGRPRVQRVSPWRFGLLLSGLALISGAAAGASALVLGRDAVAARELRDPSPPAVGWETVRAHAAWYPLDARVWLREGVRLWKAGDAQAERVIAWAVRVSPPYTAARRTWIAYLRHASPERHLLAMQDMARATKGKPREQAFLLDEVLRAPDLAAHPARFFGEDLEHLREYLQRVAREPVGDQPRLYEAVYRDYRQHLEIATELAEVALARGFQGLASAVNAWMLGMYPDLPRTWYLLGREYELKGRNDEALRLLRLARRMAKGCDASICGRLFRLAVEARSLEEADELLDALARLNSVPRWQMGEYRARLHAARGELDEAVFALDQALNDEPGRVALLSLKARVLEDAGRFTSAASLYDRLHLLTGDLSWLRAAQRLRDKARGVGRLPL
jgi:tetratricopeptide (TPR) repeat protein